jgi:hypothetical protein
MLALKLGLSLNNTKNLEGWKPSDETSLEAWYKYETGITLNGSDVSAWADSSGKGHDLSQATAAAQPAYSGGVLTFDGTDDNLASNQINLAALSACTIAIRGNFSSGTGTMLGDDDGTNAFINMQATNEIRVRPTGGPADFILASGNFGEGYIVITRDSSNNFNAYYNGASIAAQVNKGGTVKIDNMGSYSTNDFFDGTIKEVQIYTSSSAALTANINTYLSKI